MPIFFCEFEILLLLHPVCFYVKKKHKMAFKPIDPKRDEFRRYLERSGVIEALTKVFVRIVKERPENPLEYLRRNLGDALHQADSLAYLQSELEEARNEIQKLRSIIESVNPDALRDLQPQEEVEKKCFEDSSENQKKASAYTAEPQEESENRGDTEKDAQPVQNGDTQQQDDFGEKLKSEETRSINVVQTNPIPAQNADNI